MERRAFLGIGMGALTAPLIGEAQQPRKVYRIGRLGGAVLPENEAFRDGLRELGYVEGKDLTIEYRSADPDLGRLPSLAAELAAVGVDVIVAVGNQAILAAKGATTTIPIVGLGVLEPVETGIVKSLARPGGNITGLAWEDSTSPATKKLELLKELVPTASRVAGVWNPTVPGLARYWPPLRTSATSLGMEIYPVEYSRPEDHDRALAIILRERPSAVFFWGDPLTTVRRQELCAFALKNRLPSLAGSRRWTQAGCLISYAPSSWDHYRRAALYVDKILKGAKPADLPMERPTKYELVINGKTTKALGLTIPPSLLLRADQVIE